MNKSILVPTDFSDNAWVAIRYAANLALDKNKKLTILHTFFPFYSSFTSMEHNIVMYEEAESMANAEMDLVKERLETEFTSLNYECLCLEGGLSKVITKESKDNNIEMIIMGTKGASGLKYAIMGSNTFDVISTSTIPVIAVPDQSEYKLQKLGVLTNYKRTDIKVLNDLADVVGRDFSTILLHVNEDANGYFEQVYAESWKDVVEDEAKLNDVNIKVGQGDKIQEVVNKMMEEEEIDLLLVTNNAKRFVQSLFTRNLVKSLALKPQIPVCFIKV